MGMNFSKNLILLGIFVGWLAIASCVFGIMVASVVIATLLTASCEDLREILESMNRVPEDFENTCSVGKSSKFKNERGFQSGKVKLLFSVAIILLVIYVFVLIGGIVVGRYCIKGTKTVSFFVHCDTHEMTF